MRKLELRLIAAANLCTFLSILIIFFRSMDVLSRDDSIIGCVALISVSIFFTFASIMAR